MRFDNIFGIHEQAMQLRSQRSEVLASNLANADTPGYKARDFDFQKILQQQETVASGHLKTTRAGHISHSDGLIPNTEMLYRQPQQASTDGNTVEVETEQAEFSANAMRYQASLRFLDGRISSLKTAIRGSA